MISDVFKKVLAALAILLVVGCNSPTNEKIDTTFLADKNTTIVIEAPNPVPYCQPVPCEQTIYGHLTDEWIERIDTSNVKLNHYINDVEVEENLADVINVNGQLATSNPITIPEYVGEPMRHVLIIEFYQNN